jgi:O-antigen/teichoic acid export membrane protein
MSNYTARKLSINIVFSLIQIFISALVLFFLYKFAIKTIGIKQFGIWSVVSTSITSLTILNYGFSGSLVKYVAKYQAKGELLKVKGLIETTIITIVVISILLSIAGYTVFFFLLRYLIQDSNQLFIAYSLLKICLITFCITIISNAFQSALEGLNFIFIKSIINIIISVVLLVLSFFLLQKFGLIGLGYAYLGANLLGLLISIFALRAKFPAFGILSWSWDAATFKETLKYNFNFQVISVFSLLNDPITKFILARFGGTEYAGLYELASRLVMQIRNILSTANQALVPIFASLHETDVSKVGIYFRNSFLYVFVLSTFLFFSILAFSPLLSTWWLGGINYVFIVFLTLITISWYINSIAMPAYFANLGSGQMKWNTISHVGMGLSNLILSFIIAFFFKAIFISIGWFLALSGFSFLIIISYIRENKISLNTIMPWENWSYLAFNVGLSFMTAVMFLKYFNGNIFSLIAIIAIYFGIQLYILLNNSLGKEVKGRLLKYIGK